LSYILKIINLLQKNGNKIRYKNILIRGIIAFIFTCSKNQISELSSRSNIVSLFQIITSTLSSFNLLFSYVITKIDKSKQKNSRGKVEKYFFLWKYVPFYKRKKIFLKIFIKEIKFINQKYLKDKFKELFLSIINNSDSYFKKNFSFINIYVFKNLRNQLFLNYKTTK
jgi:hypothetical protein